MSEERIYQSPDIRRQTIEDAEEFLQGKRTRRMITLMTYKQEREEKLTKLQGKELERFEKQAERVQGALDRASEAIRKATDALAKLQGTHNALSNVEDELKEL